MTPKNILRNLCPPLIWRTASRLRRKAVLLQAEDRLQFCGNYATWEDAQRASGGYSAPNILAKTRAALLQVVNGEAAFERDSLVFAQMEHRFPLLSGLLYAATASMGRLSVLDFGGALGSTYYQSRTFLSGVKNLSWSIVEQPEHVACGQADFANDRLQFYATVEECERAARPNVLLLSSVIQYLPAPYDFLGEILSHDFPYVIVDRTAFMRDGSTRLTVEHVPAWIYPASYPSWFLSEPRFLRYFAAEYRQLASFTALDCTDPEGGVADYKGFIFERK